LQPVSFILAFRRGFDLAREDSLYPHNAPANDAERHAADAAERLFEMLTRDGDATPLPQRYELYHRKRRNEGVSLIAACCIAFNLVMGSGFLALPAAVARCARRFVAWKEAAPLRACKVRFVDGSYQFVGTDGARVPRPTKAAQATIERVFADDFALWRAVDAAGGALIPACANVSWRPGTLQTV